eukprot:TRINITY_DN15769_c0_g1_i6.p1 TRINITY_DN15769_c0_g1~~TRINITY_DN15769_c0_g1_i6.p1  ORF type:complete len:322 (-),score=60.76 TRINITY_DN15769_c0_g1_i6:63-1028(-)
MSYVAGNQNRLPTTTATTTTTTTTATTTARLAAASKRRFKKPKQIWRDAQPSVTAPNKFHSYDVDPLDHAETEPRALGHAAAVLRNLALEMSKISSSLKLWDPYFCKGAMKEHFKKLGFTKVHNANEDCYAVFKSGNLPEHDVIISNPPYSEDHIEKCLKFCVSNRKPWLLLLPNWVASKPYYKEVLGKKASDVFFISPVERYCYMMPRDLVVGRSRPDWVGDDGRTSPYNSSWFIYLPKVHPKIYAQMEAKGGSKHGCEWVLGRSIKAAKWKLKKISTREEVTQPSGAKATMNRKAKNKKSSTAPFPQETKRIYEGTVEF